MPLSPDDEARRAADPVCAMCENPILKGEWFLVIIKAPEDLQQGTPLEGPEVLRAPVHANCLVMAQKKLPQVDPPLQGQCSTGSMSVEDLLNNLV